MATTNTYTNDYTLLRDFDVEAAKAGEPIQSEIGTLLDYIAHYGTSVFVKINETALVLLSDSVKMKPLFWLEGKPIYAGDTVYHVVTGKGTTTDKKNSWGEYMIFFEDPTKVGACGCIISNLSLSPFPPVKQERKGWINIWKCSSAIGVSTGSQVYTTKEEALRNVLCVGNYLVDTVEITWME